MSGKTVNVANATDLLLLGESAKHVPPKTITEALLKGLCHQESDIGLYECLFTNIIHHFEPRKFEAEVSCIVLPELVIYLEKIQQELQTNALSYFFLENLTVLLRLADVLQKLIQYLIEQRERCHLYHSLIIFPEYLIRCYAIVRQNYVTMAKESNVLEAMKTLYTVCKRILMAFLELLCPKDATTCGTYFRLIDNEEDYECLEKVCTLLAGVGNEISPIDSLLASDVWKAILKLSTEHAERCVTANRSVWLSQVILTLNSGIDAAVSEIRMKNEPSKQTTISLKLNAFFLRVMQKLLTLLPPHTSREVFRSIITTLLRIKSCLTSNAAISNDLAAGIDQFLHIGYMAIIENSVRHEAFAKEFCHYESKTNEEIHSYYSLLTHVIGHIVSNASDSNLVATYCYRQNLLANVCTLLKQSDSLLLHNASLYKQILIHCAGLILVSVRLKTRESQKTIEDTLVRMVLQEHYYTGLLAIDLWSVFVRYHSTELLINYFVFWKQINDRYPIFRTRPQHIFVAQLLRNLWTFLPAAQMCKLLDTFPVSDEANDHLWSTVPLSGEIDEVHRKRFAESVLKRLQNRLNDLQCRPTVEGFYETLRLLLITNNSCISSHAAKEMVNRFWNTLVDWNEIWTNVVADTLLDCLQKSSDTLPARMINSNNGLAFTDTSVFVKCIVVKRMERASPSLNITTVLEPLLEDHYTLVAAFAFNVLRKLNDKQHPAVQQFLEKCPHAMSQLSGLQQIKRAPDNLVPHSSLSVSHRCRLSHEPVATESCGDITMVINNEIDALFPDDDDEDDAMSDLNLGLLTDKVSETKKRKIEEKEKHSLCSSEVQILRCIRELEVQGKLLEKLTQSEKLEVIQKGRLQRIICMLTKALDS